MLRGNLFSVSPDGACSVHRVDWLVRRQWSAISFDMSRMVFPDGSDGFGQLGHVHGPIIPNIPSLVRYRRDLVLRRRGWPDCASRVLGGLHGWWRGEAGVVGQGVRGGRHGGRGPAAHGRGRVVVPGDPGGRDTAVGLRSGDALRDGFLVVGGLGGVGREGR